METEPCTAEKVVAKAVEAILVAVHTVTDLAVAVLHGAGDVIKGLVP